jgi:hypothetical protein
MCCVYPTSTEQLRSQRTKAQLLSVVDCNHTALLCMADQVEFIDTPGLSAASTCTADNRSILKAVRAAYKWHK